MAATAPQSWESTPTFGPVGDSAGLPQSAFAAPPGSSGPRLFSSASFASRGGTAAGAAPSER